MYCPYDLNGFDDESFRRAFGVYLERNHEAELMAILEEIDPVAHYPLFICSSPDRRPRAHAAACLGNTAVKPSATSVCNAEALGGGLHTRGGLGLLNFSSELGSLVLAHPKKTLPLLREAITETLVKLLDSAAGDDYFLAMKANVHPRIYSLPLCPEVRRGRCDALCWDPRGCSACDNFWVQIQKPTVSSIR